jgi:hypothetical protein
LKDKVYLLMGCFRQHRVAPIVGTVHCLSFH